MVRCIVNVLAFCALLFAGAAHADDRATAIQRAVFVDDTLWVMTETSDLYSIREGEFASRKETPHGQLDDLCVHKGGLLALAFDGETWTFARRADGAWKTQGAVTTLPQRHENHEALNCDGDAIVQLTSHRLIERPGKRQHAIMLSGDASGRGKATNLRLTKSDAYADYDAGDTIRIDRASGRMTTIERAAVPQKPLPAFETYGNFRVSFERPDAVWIMSGDTPMMVPR